MCGCGQSTAMDFNPRSRVGSDSYTWLYYCAKPDFNPRSRVGSDRLIVLYSRRDINFNPRSRVGSDVSNEGFPRLDHGISIHAPA